MILESKKIKSVTVSIVSITSWQIDGGGGNGNNDSLYFLGLQTTVDGDCSHEIKRRLLLGRNDKDL